MLKKLLIILFIPLVLLSEDVQNKTVKLIKENNKNTTIQDNVNINSLKQEEKNVQEDENLSEEEKQIAQQNKLLEDVITNINNENFLKTSKNIKEYKTELNLLTNRININKRANNTLAAKRDELNVLVIKDKLLYEQTLRDIILAKQEFKDIQYFQDILDAAIKSLQETKISSYEKTYESESKVDNTISKAFSKNYVTLYNQNHTQVFVLQYLRDNISKFRKTNFFIDEFNLQYLVTQIDSIKGISYISSLTSYHLKFSVGEIVVVLFIITFFRLLNLKIISFFTNVVTKLIVKSSQEESDVIRKYLKVSIDGPLIYGLYTLAIQISIYILVKDAELISQIMPWINTIYMALFTWAVYSILNNSINIYAHSLLEKYPNVRKEMIVFILRIIKIILILLVILFLFSQLGIDIKAIAASLGVGGIAIALASKDTLANFFGSLNIMTDNSFSQGDWIKTSEIEGTVVDIRMRTTRIRTFDNAMITVPNSQLANTHIMNWSKRKIGRRIKMSVGITYESKMEDIVNLKNDIHEMLLNHQGIATDKNSEIAKSKRFEAIKNEDLNGVKRTLLVYIDEFDASSINILVYCFSRSPVWQDWLEVKEDVLIKIAQLAEKNNCEFAYPTQTLWLNK